MFWLKRAVSYWWVLPILFLTGLGLYWLVPSWQAISMIPTTETRVSSEIELVKAVAQVALGLLVLGTLYVTWRRAKAAEQTVAVAQEGQITERFTRAIEQLGSEKMEIRLGGIFALERIARDSKKDHWQVIEVLTAYVRENAPADGISNPKPFRSVSVDIQAILEVLGRRKVAYESPNQKLNLRMTDLRGAELEGAILQNVDLRMTDLHNVIFKDADLRGAKMFHASIRNANLDGADLRGAKLGVLWNWTQSQLDSAVTDEKTNFPEGYTTRGK